MSVQADLLFDFICEGLEFNSWLRSERERLHNIALQVMAKLTGRYLRNGRIEEAESLARAQLKLEPLDPTFWHHDHSCQPVVRFEIQPVTVADLDSLD